MKFSGLGVAMVTPFDNTGRIDLESLKRLTDYLITEGADYLVVQGTTGESPALSTNEKQLVLETVQEVNNGQKPIVFGVGGNHTATVVKQLSQLDNSRVDGILSVSPYYNKPGQSGIYEHYKAVACATDLPVILYNVPGRSASNLQAETTLRLARDFENIVGVKEASGDLDQIMTIIRDRPKDFLVISGDDALTLPMISCGADGVISVLGNCMPRDFGSMVHLAIKGKMDEARKLHYKLLEITRLLFKEGNPAGVKEVLRYLNISENHIRLPLMPVTPQTSAQIELELKERGWIQ